MRLTRNLLALALALLVFGAFTALAGPVGRKDKGASNNGVGPESISFATCDLVTNLENCGIFAAAPFETVDGVSVLKFVTNDGMGDVNLYDVFTLPGTIGVGSQLKLILNNIDNAYGDFACDNGTAGAMDSNGKPLVGPCTIGNTSALAAFLSETDSGNTATIAFAGSGLPSSWTFYTADGNLANFSVTSGTTSAPEPGSASLLFAGALAAGLLALKARR
jgi:hypothetical protein